MRDWLDKVLFGTDDRRQRLRLRRFFMALVSYAMWFGVAWAALRAGQLAVPYKVLGYAAIGILVTQGVFYWLFRSGRNLRFADPSLTMTQIVVALGWVLVLMAWTREVRGLMVSLYMVTLLFGIFGLNRRQFIIVSVIAFLCFAALVATELFFDPGKFPLEMQLISLLVLGVVLIWTAFFGSYIGNLRYRLSRRNDELEQALGRIQELAERDDLTGLYNRRYIVDALQRLKSGADRGGEPFSVCIVDLDHFKKVNDRYGHAVGDRVLVEFSRLARDSIRGMDFLAPNIADALELGRFGGEEFILLLPETGVEGARICAERLRERQENAGTHRPGAHVTLSAGVAQYMPGESTENLLRRADHALYEAKKTGRNRVVVAGA